MPQENLLVDSFSYFVTVFTELLFIYRLFTPKPTEQMLHYPFVGISSRLV